MSLPSDIFGSLGLLVPGFVMPLWFSYNEPTEALQLLSQLELGAPLLDGVRRSGVPVRHVPELSDCEGVYKITPTNSLIALKSANDPTVAGHEARHHWQAQILKKLGYDGTSKDSSDIACTWVVSMISEFDAFSCQGILAMEHLRRSGVDPRDASAALKNFALPLPVVETVIKHYPGYFNSGDKSILRRAARESFDQLYQSGWVVNMYRRGQEIHAKALSDPALRDHSFLKNSFAVAAYDAASAWLKLKHSLSRSFDKADISTPLLTPEKKSLITDVISHFGELPAGAGNYLEGPDLPALDVDTICSNILDARAQRVLFTCATLLPAKQKLYEHLRYSRLFDPRVARYSSILDTIGLVAQSANQISARTSAYDL